MPPLPPVAKPAPVSIDRDRFLTETEVAAKFQVSKVWLRHCRIGRLKGGPPFVKVGLKSVRYRLSALNAWVQERTREAS